MPSVVGPMARSLASIETVTKLVIDARPWDHDPTCHPLPWREDMYREIQDRPMIIGLMVDDGVVKVHPPIERVLLEVAEALRQAGHTVVPWTSDGHKDAVDVMVCALHFIDVLLLIDNVLGSVLHGRWRRRHQARCRCWRRTVCPSCRSSRIASTSHLRVRVLATQPPKARGSKAVSGKVESHWASHSRHSAHASDATFCSASQKL